MKNFILGLFIGFLSFIFGLALFNMPKPSGIDIIDTYAVLLTLENGKLLYGTNTRASTINANLVPVARFIIEQKAVAKLKMRGNEILAINPVPRGGFLR